MSKNQKDTQDILQKAREASKTPQEASKCILNRALRVGRQGGPRGTPDGP